MLIKIFRWLIKDELFKVDVAMDQRSMQKWLFDSFNSQGFKEYYTMRKKALSRANLQVMTKFEDYLENACRFKELESLKTNIELEVKRRKEASDQPKKK